MGERVNGIHEVRGSIPLASMPSGVDAGGRSQVAGCGAVVVVAGGAGKRVGRALRGR